MNQRVKVTFDCSRFALVFKVIQPILAQPLSIKKAADVEITTTRLFDDILKLPTMLFRLSSRTCLSIDAAKPTLKI